MSAHRVADGKFIGSQIEEETRRPLTYMGSPFRLLISDLTLFLCNIFYLPLLFIPLFPWPNGPLDELYPSLPNLRDIALHSFLFFVQLGFLISLPILTYLSFSLYVSYIGVVLGVNYLVCRLLNAGISGEGLRSTEDAVSRSWKPHPDEFWIFLNGICVGKHWLQNNVDLISRTFHRPVVGVHNETFGVVFDFVQCLIQRVLFYATSDVRTCYVAVKKALYRPRVKKVVLILHSQGGIEGGMIVDWLLNEVPHDLLQSLEVYTFGCLANHFSNPYRNSASSTAPTTTSASNSVDRIVPRQRVISHIEHYANAYEFASKWGVLNYTRTMPRNKLENRFMGSVFVNPQAGHQFNQHYLGSIFPLDPTGCFTRNPREGDFMLMDVGVGRGGGLQAEATDTGIRNVTPTSPFNPRTLSFPPLTGGAGGGTGTTLKMWQLSRLWLYRNGGSPAC